jgi:TPR repeat protein
MNRYDDTAIDQLIWEAIGASECPEDFRAYLDHRPENAAHLDEALDRLVELDDADAACNEGELRYPAAIAAIEALANTGNATAKFHMGKVLEHGIGMPRDIGRGVAWYRLAILQGETRSHINLGNLLLEGDATPADFDEAKQLYAKAAELGEPMGTFILGRLAAAGRGEESGRPNLVRALELFHAAWDEGDKMAAWWIGYKLRAGDGVRQDKALGREWIEKSATAGCSGAMQQMGSDAEHGRGCEKDAYAAADWYRRAAELGDMECQCKLANLLLRGEEGIAKDGAQAVRWLKCAAARNDANAQRMLGVVYLLGIDVVRNVRFGRKWLTRAAENGDADAAWRLGHLLQQDDEPDPPAATKWFLQAALAGHSEAQAALGTCYWRGPGVDADAHAAFKWIHLSALQGEPQGLYLLGRLYRDGVGVEADYAQAAQYFRRAAERGDASGQGHLGWCYLHGKGVDRDIAEGMLWLARAAEQGDAAASRMIGRALLEGIGVERNAAEASKWLLDAAEKGDASGQYELALLYAEGRGLQQNGEEARQWMEKAAAQGDESASTWLKAQAEVEFNGST